MSDVLPSASLATEDLKAWMHRVLKRYGMFAADAEILIERLLEAELRGGVAGVRLLSEIVEAFDVGDIDPRARPLTTVDLPAFAIIDGSTGVGQVGATRAMQFAIEKSQTAGIALVIIRHSQPCGDVGVIAELAARAGCLGLCTTNSGKGVFPGGDDGAWLARHPQAWSFPVDSTTGWVGGQELSLEDFPSSNLAGNGLLQGIVSLALTAGLTGSRLPVNKKKSSPYGAGAEHCCLAIHLSAAQAEGSWKSWVDDTLPRAVEHWRQVAWTPPPPTIQLNSRTLDALKGVAKQSRIELSAESGSGTPSQ